MYIGNDKLDSVVEKENFKISKKTNERSRIRCSTSNILIDFLLKEKMKR